MKRLNNESFKEYKLRRKLDRIITDCKLCGYFYDPKSRTKVLAAEGYYRNKYNRVLGERKDE